MNDDILLVCEWLGSFWPPSCSHTTANVARNLMRELGNWRWSARKGLFVQRNSVEGQPPWSLLDADRKVVAQGDTPQEAISKARQEEMQARRRDYLRRAGR
jgi:hypothetical protein